MSRGGGGSGSSSPEGPSGNGGGDAWRRTYDRLQGLLPRVEELAADRARLKAANKAQRELSESSEKSVHARLLQAEASRERWKTAYIELPLLGNPKIAELQESDLVDSRGCEPPFQVDNSQLMIKSKEVGNCVETSQENADNGGIARDLRAELKKLKQAYKTLSSNKDKEISAAKDFLWNELRRKEKDNAGLLKIKDVEAAQAKEASQKLQQNMEELQVAVRNRDYKIGILRAEAGLLKIKEVEAAQKLQLNVDALQVAVQNKDDENGRLQAESVNAKKRLLILEGKLMEMYSLVKEKNDEIQKLKNGQAERLKCKCSSSISAETSEDIGLLSEKKDKPQPSKDTNEMHLEQCMETSKDVGLFPEKKDSEDTNEMHLEQYMESSDGTDQDDLEQCTETSEDSDDMHLEQGTIYIGWGFPQTSAP